MKTAYIARQAILDAKSNTVGYELLFRDSPENKFPDIDQDIATSKLIIQNHIQGDINVLSMGKPAYINFTENSLINKYPLMFDKNSIVIELVGHKTSTVRLLKIIKFYHEKGYKIALSEYDLAEQWDVLFPFLSIIKVDIEKINAKRLRPVCEKIRAFDIKLIAEKVETKFQRQSLAEVGFNYYQGYFYHEPEIIEGQTLTPVKTQMLHLITETFHSPLDFDTVSTIISQDVNLTVGLLKMVNNVTTGVRVEITSLKQAAAYLGEDKLKQFVSILALSKLTSDCIDEVSKQALITGKLMASLAIVADFRSVSDFAFITGLLSAIEVVLKMPIADIMKTMPLAEPIANALINRAGLLGELLALTSDYMTGKAEDMAERLEQYSLDAEFVHQEFVSAVQWCNDLAL